MLKVIPVTFAIFASLILTGCSSMNNFSKSLGHHEVYTETVIAAEPEEVWAVITDAPNYKLEPCDYHCRGHLLRRRYHH